MYPSVIFILCVILLTNTVPVLKTSLVAFNSISETETPTDSFGISLFLYNYYHILSLSNHSLLQGPTNPHVVQYTARYVGTYNPWALGSQSSNIFKVYILCTKQETNLQPSTINQATSFQVFDRSDFSSFQLDHPPLLLGRSTVDPENQAIHCQSGEITRLPNEFFSTAVKCHMLDAFPFCPWDLEHSKSIRQSSNFHLCRTFLYISSIL